MWIVLTPTPLGSHMTIGWEMFLTITLRVVISPTNQIILPGKIVFFPTFSLSIFPHIFNCLFMYFLKNYLPSPRTGKFNDWEQQSIILSTKYPCSTFIFLVLLDSVSWSFYFSTLNFVFFRLTLFFWLSLVLSQMTSKHLAWSHNILSNKKNGKIQYLIFDKHWNFWDINKVFLLF